MLKGIFLTSLLMLFALLIPAPAMSTVIFDFDEVPLPYRKTPGGSLVEVYMEGLYGSDVSVSSKTSAAHGASILNSLDLDNSYLKIGKGKGPSAIVINFVDDPIDSFSVDFKLFKKAKNFSILADGQLISMDTLSKAQRKTGLSGEKIFFFDSPVHTLEFIGKSKKSFAIDNLVVDLSSGDHTSGGGIIETLDLRPFEETELPSDDNNNEENAPVPTFITPNFIDSPSLDQVAVPEPSSFLLLLFGFAAARLKSCCSKRRSS
jgi:PEP-CTERM motif